MSSREKILAQLKKNLVENQSLPDLVVPVVNNTNHLERLRSVLEGIGGKFVEAEDWNDVIVKLRAGYPAPNRWLNVIPELAGLLDSVYGSDPHLLENVKLGILKGHFAVAESGAVWITAELMGDRALPYICEHLALVVNSHDILPTMYDAYERIGSLKYDFGTFIAGPSKTADIEQALVLGAHGPKSMTLVVLRS